MKGKVRQGFYIYYCDKCEQYIRNTFTLAKNKKVAAASMSDPIMEHDLECHGPDMEFPTGKIVCLVLKK